MSGTTTLEPRRWWGRAWNALLDEAGPAGARAVQRGQALSRRGAVEDLQVSAGAIAARVVGERGDLQEVALRCPVLDEEQWARAVARLADELRFTAALLDGDLPEGLDAVLDEIGLRLLPTWQELEVTCSCREPEPCRHTTAMHVASGIAIDRDPFLLVRLRGWSRRRLLAALRSHRGRPDVDPTTATLDLSGGLSAARGDLDAITLHPAPVEDPAGLLRHLGPPPGVDDDRPLAALIGRAAATAWRLAAGDGADAADEELLLAELRAQRVATPASLAAALGREAAVVRAELDRLFEAGVVLRTGSGERTRYRAASA